MDTEFGQDESELIGEIYEAAMNPALWQRVLDRVRYVAAADRSNLTFFDQINRKRNSTVVSGDYPPEAVSQYLDLHIDDDIKMVRAGHEGLQEGEFFFPSPSQYRCEIGDNIVGQEYKDFFQGDDLRDGPGFATVLLKNTFSLSLLGIVRHKGSKPFDPAILSFWNRIGTHLCRAIRIQNQLISSNEQHLKLQQVLERSAAGIALLDGQGRVIFANAEAGRICQTHPALEIGPGGSLRATDSSEHKRLVESFQKLLNSLNAATRVDTPLSLSLRHSSTFHPVRVTLIPLSLIGEVGLAIPGIACAVFLNDPVRKWNVSNAYMQEAYQLTASECEVASALLNGFKAAEIARMRKTAEDTVRWQIKNILQKTQSRSQVELVKLLVNINCDFGRAIS